MGDDMKGRSAFSLAELLLVLVLVGVMLALIMPKLGASYAARQVSSARARVGALAARARAVAQARSCVDTLHITSGTTGKAWITACAPNGTGLDTVTVGDSLAARYSVTIGAAQNFVFDTRGMNASGASTSITISKNSTTDSVVIDATGRVIH
jgi:type II secretory pathway pseudopilin PulG